MKTTTNKDGAARAAITIAAICGFILTASVLNAQGYDTYAGNAGLVTIVQIEQAQRERANELTFRNMSIADRWDASSAGSLASRWSDSGSGSIAARWNPGAFGSLERRWK